MLSESFQHGLKDGLWTKEQVQECGFTSAQECLAHQEQVYLNEIRNIPSLARKNPAYAQKHQEYMNGLIQAERKSLGEMS